jgi:hypothetical protein
MLNHYQRSSLFIVATYILIVTVSRGAGRLIAEATVTEYYVYNLVDADGVVRYVGKGTGRRAHYHLGVVLALVGGALVTRACKVHRHFAAEMRIGRHFRVVVVADGLSQAEAYATEARTIAVHRRESEGGTLWNVLAGGEGFQGILRADWMLVARQAAVTKQASGSGRRAGVKAAATKALTGTGLLAGVKAAATKRAKLYKTA